MKNLSFYFYVFYCFEVGIFLVICPWYLPELWEQNYFFLVMPGLKNLFLNPFFRGAVSGLGIVNITLGIIELVNRDRAKRLMQLK